MPVLRRLRDIFGVEEMRKSCLGCVKKHLAQAIVLLCESKKGYPMHKWLALGHIAEAEDEASRDHLELANRLRDVRIKFEKDDYGPDLLEIIEGVIAMESE